jgi:hypothetical protein
MLHGNHMLNSLQTNQPIKASAATTPQSQFMLTHFQPQATQQQQQQKTASMTPMTSQRGNNIVKLQRPQSSSQFHKARKIVNSRGESLQ